MPAQNKIPRTPQTNKTNPKKASQNNGGHNRTPSAAATPLGNNTAKRSSVNIPRPQLQSMAPTATPAAAAGLDYDKIQRDEVEALKAIFGDDYEHVETASAWNVSQPEFCFEINISI
jgi:hypothetical protein